MKDFWQFTLGIIGGLVLCLFASAVYIQVNGIETGYVLYPMQPGEAIGAATNARGKVMWSFTSEWREPDLMATKQVNACGEWYYEPFLTMYEMDLTPRDFQWWLEDLRAAP